MPALVVLSATSAVADCPQLIVNSDFSSGLVTPWVFSTPDDFASVDYSVSSDAFQTLTFDVDAFDGAPYLSDVVLSHEGISLIMGETYKVSFWGLADSTTSAVTAGIKVGGSEDPFPSYGLDDEFDLLWGGGEGSTHSFTFVANATDNNAGLVFFLGGQDGTYKLDGIIIEQTSSSECAGGSSGGTGMGGAGGSCPQQIINGDFSSGVSSPWVFETPGDFAIEDHSVSDDIYQNLTIDVDAFDSDPWQSDVVLSQGVSVVAGEVYRVSLWASSTTPVTAGIKVGESTDPYDALGLEDEFDIIWGGGDGSAHHFTFTATKTAADAGLVFFLGGADTTIRLDSILFETVSSGNCGGDPVGTGGSSGTGGSGATGSSEVAVNQLGYALLGDKVATIKNSSDEALSWELVEGSDVLLSGETTDWGVDAISGDFVHLADFSDFMSAASGVVLRVDGQDSLPFDLGDDLYPRLRRDALRFFYHQRSSMAVQQPYAEGAQWERLAGHLDASVPCRSGTGCSYSLNVSHGWYDAGDYGKYVVNGGVAVWTLMNLYERAEHLGAGVSEVGDGTSNIPEGDNGVSDLLDEVRWEMDFLMGMQVPAGQTLEGMAHHKVHGTTWPAIPTLPNRDDTGRVLSAPSTAATLNLAATAAQCARVFAPVDDAYSKKCLAAAESAFDAATAHPAVFAVSGDADDDGGGAYDDNTVTDEFYWAAAELFITTGEAKYQTLVTDSPHHATLNEEGSPFGWQSTHGLGVVSLATVPNDLSSAEKDAIRAAVLGAADSYSERANFAYGTAMTGYYWGSNSDVLNAGMVQALAFDLTGDAAYRMGAIGALDYVLGRNPLGQSYVTQYGANPFENAHHRIFANAYSSSAPKPPPGFLAGGPNEALDGLEPQGSLAGCEGPDCWTDNEKAYGLTEVTVNWNAPLAWMAAWAADLRDAVDQPGGDGDGDGDMTGDGDGDASGDGDGDMGGASGDGDAACEAGAEGCACYGNNTCDEGLSCLSKLCVDEHAKESSGGSSEKSGCGCKQAGGSKAPRAPLAFLALPLLLLIRRRFSRGVGAPGA